MLIVRTTKALFSDVPSIVSIDVNTCHANIKNYFMKLWVINVHWVTCEVRFLCKKHFLETLNRRNSQIAKILLIAKLLQQHFANSQPGGETSVFPKAVSSSLGSAVPIGGRLHNLLRNKNPLYPPVSNAHYILRFPWEKAWTTINIIDSVQGNISS